MVTDPVCLKQLDERKTEEKTEFRGQTYYFDSERCKDVFDEEPLEFVGQIEEITYGDHGHRLPS